jgi:hypothetical protein
MIPRFSVNVFRQLRSIHQRNFHVQNFKEVQLIRVIEINLRSSFLNRTQMLQRLIVYQCKIIIVSDRTYCFTALSKIYFLTYLLAATSNVYKFLRYAGFHGK